MNSTYQQLCHNLDTSKLPQMHLHLSEVADFVATNNLSFSEGLLKLTNYEVDYKAENAARSMIKAGAFPFIIYVISVNRIFLGPCSSNSRFTILGAVYAVAIAFAILR